jgi:hypothetical protein
MPMQNSFTVVVHVTEIFQLLFLHSGTSPVVKYSVCSCKLLRVLLCLGSAEALCEKSHKTKSDGTPESIILTLAEFIAGCITYHFHFNGMSTGGLKTLILVHLQR